MLLERMGFIFVSLARSRVTSFCCLRKHVNGTLQQNYHQLFFSNLPLILLKFFQFVSG